MKTILVPTDFSKNADNALKYAIEFAKKEQSKLIILHAYQINYSEAYIAFDVLAEEKNNLRTEAESKLKALSLRLKSEDNINSELLCADDFTVDAILETIKNKNVDLVVMGTRGATGLQEFLFGSNTAKVIRNAKCPVIAVPQDATFRPLKKITYATDYLATDINDLKKIVEFANEFKAQVTVLHVTEEIMSKESEEDSMRIFKNASLKEINYPDLNFKLVKGGDIEKTLADFVNTDTTDLLVTSVHHRDILDRIFSKNISKNLSYHTKVPLMAFHHTSSSVSITF